MQAGEQRGRGRDLQHGHAPGGWAERPGRPYPCLTIQTRDGLETREITKLVFTEDEIKGEIEKALAANRQKLKPDAVFLNARPGTFLNRLWTVTLLVNIVGFMTAHWTIHELAEAVNVWCRDRALEPANGQTASELSARTLYYYRSSGLLDAPESGAGRGYGRRHLLQLKAIRVLQAQGLPLSRIQQLLFGRSDEELKQIVGSVGKTVPRAANVPHPLVSQETWTTYPLNERLFLVARDGTRLSADQLEAIRAICDASPNQSLKPR